MDSEVRLSIGHEISHKDSRHAMEACLLTYMCDIPHNIIIHLSSLVDYIILAIDSIIKETSPKINNHWFCCMLDSIS
jgi:hypothetical protein